MKLKRLGVICLAVLFIALFAACASAEGSHELTPDSLHTGKWRAFIEWYPSIYFSSGDGRLPRRQVIKAYAKEGETIYFGSSVSEAAYKKYASSEPNVVSPETIQDIRMKLPDGTYLDYDVIRNAKGYIGVTPDSTGTKISFIQDVGPSVFEAGGYDAFAYTVPAGGEGIYEFYFYSALESKLSSIRRVAAHSVSPWAANPSDPTDLTYGERNAQMQGIAAWDVTVANASTRIPGRVFSNYLTITLGSNDYLQQSFFDAKLYVLTQDGYIYRTDFNGMNPDGFLFFGNNRGLIDLKTGNSVYHSTIYTDNSMKELMGGIGFRLPNQPNTDTDFTYEIFFNEPDQEILRYFGREEPNPPASISSFTFNNSQPTPVGQGGDFMFVADQAGAFQIEIKFQNDSDNVLYIANRCKAGMNSIHWDGKDYYGNPVQEGTYKATLRMKAGEYHFPIADVEACINGMEVMLVNAEMPDPYKVYYDHSRITINGTDLRHDIGQDAFFERLNLLQGVSSQKDQNGISNAMRWGTSDEGIEGYLLYGDPKHFSKNSLRNGYGNFKLFDVWTWFSTDADLYTTPFTVGDPPVLPDTGDAHTPLLWMVMVILSCSAIVILTRRKIKQCKVDNK